MSKLVARKSDDYKPFVLVFLVQFFQPCELWRKTAFACCVDDKQYFAPELGEEEDSPNAYPSLASMRQEIANLPDAAARDYLTKLFEL